MDAHRLIRDWRARAEHLRRYAPEVANVWEDAATELDAFLHGAERETLSLKQAAAESGYTAGHLSRLLAIGTLPNAGKPHAPRVRRGDLPRKPRTSTPLGPDVAGDILRQRGLAGD